MKKNSYYAVIAAKKRRGRRYAMVVPYEELDRLMGSRVPVYFQKPCRNKLANDPNYYFSDIAFLSEITNMLKTPKRC